MPYKNFFIKKSAKKSNIKNILYKQLLYKICLQKTIIKNRVIKHYFSFFINFLLVFTNIYTIQYKYVTGTRRICTISA